MRKYVIMGVQGSGKGTQSQMLAADLDLVHISVGDIFRWNVQNHTKMGARSGGSWRRGSWSGTTWRSRWSRTGSPSTTGTTASSSTGSRGTGAQAEFFLESYDIDGVIELDLPDSEVRRRVLNRRLCADCGMDYNLIGNSPEGPRPLRLVRGRAGHQGRRHRGGAGGPAAGLPREDQPGARPVPAQGVRLHGGRAARARGRPGADQEVPRPAALPRRRGARREPGIRRCVRSPSSAAPRTRR